jgi:hypothetical protein
MGLRCIVDSVIWVESVKLFPFFITPCMGKDRVVVESGNAEKQDVCIEN